MRGRFDRRAARGRRGGIRARVAGYANVARCSHAWRPHRRHVNLDAPSRCWARGHRPASFDVVRGRGCRRDVDLGRAGTWSTPVASMIDVTPIDSHFCDRLYPNVAPPLRHNPTTVDPDPSILPRPMPLYPNRTRARLRRFCLCHPNLGRLLRHHNMSRLIAKRSLGAVVRTAACVNDTAG